MRTTQQLLQILLDNTKKKFKLGCRGLCSVTVELHIHRIITYDEYNELLGYVESNMPSNYALHEWHRPGVWGWEPGNVTPRLKWLLEQIKLK